MGYILKEGEGLNQKEALISNIDDWCQELLLRGIDQLGEHDIDTLEKMKLQGTSLHMDFLVTLLTSLIQHSREYVFGKGKQQEVAPIYFQVAAYVQLLHTGYK